MVYTLPVNVNLLKDDDSIDMSESSFEVDGIDTIKLSFIFIRNTDLNINFDFSKCSYEQKSEYLKLFMFGPFDVNIQILTNTWMEILLSKGCDQIVLPCIFTRDEIDRFVNDNEELLSDINQLIISLPVFSLFDFSKIHNDESIDTELYSYEKTDYNKINLHNFASLTHDPDLVQLIKPNKSMHPLFYTEYFTDYQSINRKSINDNLPYLKLLSLIYGSESQRESFIQAFSDFLNKREENKPDE